MLLADQHYIEKFQVGDLGIVQLIQLNFKVTAREHVR